MSDTSAATSSIVKVNGVPIEVRRIGSGPDVLFIHGVFVTGYVWDDVVAKIADRFTCWVPTMPLGGNAAALPPSWKPTLDDLGQLVPALIEALDLTNVTVVGNDSGGGFVLLALGSGAAGLDRIKGVVLLNCDSFDHLPPKAFGPIIKLCRGVPAAGRALLSLMLTSSFGRKKFVKSVATTGVPAGRRDQFFGSRAVMKDAVTVTCALVPTAAQQEMAWLAKIDLPVAVVWGDDDQFFPKSDATRLVDAIPGATLTWVPGARTFVQIDDPEAVAVAIESINYSD
jgi:pimeloyl-ACP methyl ester carboxylesterase